MLDMPTSFPSRWLCEVLESTEVAFLTRNHPVVSKCPNTSVCSFFWDMSTDTVVPFSYCISTIIAAVSVRIELEFSGLCGYSSVGYVNCGWPVVDT